MQSKETIHPVITSLLWKLYSVHHHYTHWASHNLTDVRNCLRIPPALATLLQSHEGMSVYWKHNGLIYTCMRVYKSVTRDNTLRHSSPCPHSVVCLLHVRIKKVGGRQTKQGNAPFFTPCKLLSGHHLVSGWILYIPHPKNYNCKQLACPGTHDRVDTLTK